MTKTTLKKPVALAIGAAIAGSMAVTGIAQANAFSATDLGQGYVQLASSHEKGEEGKCGEGKCGANKKGEEGKCGEGKCGADKKGEEGKCGGDKKGEEGKCGGNKEA